jgi:tRNA threonylcarbamoyladenosine biosynthesis protein TsaE
MTKSKSLKETRKIAQKVLDGLLPNKGATVLALSGDLGSGKTAFAKEIGYLLGIPTDEITSPTFVIMKIFDIPAPGGVHHSLFDHFIHIDAFRLEKEIELTNLGWNEIVADPKNLIIVEWPEIVKGLIPKDAVTIKFKFTDEETREIVVK